MLTVDQRLRNGLQSEVKRHPKLGEEVAALQQSGLSLKDALYRLVKTAGAGRSIRGGAAAALLDGGLLDSVDILLNDFFNATEQNLIWEAAESLRQARAKRAVPRLIAALYDPDPEQPGAA